MKYYKTSEIAKAVGLHPNTIRLYEEWGLLPEVPRSPSGYRLFTRDHMDQVKLIRLLLRCTMFGREIKHTAYEVIKLSARGSYSDALDCAERLKVLLQSECSQAEEAERFLEQWGRRGNSKSADLQPMPEINAASAVPAASAALSRNEAAKLLDITPDTLRDWERNGLIAIPRDPRNGYRIYGTDEINKLRIIRALRRSNYSNMAILRAVQKLESGSAEGLKEVLDSPEMDEERDYLCFTDTLLTSLRSAIDAANESTELIKDKETSVASGLKQV